MGESWLSDAVTWGSWPVTNKQHGGDVDVVLWCSGSIMGELAGCEQMGELSFCGAATWGERVAAAAHSLHPPRPLPPLTLIAEGRVSVY